MNEQNEQSHISAAPVILPAKRKRGRPRKDGNLTKKDEGCSKPALVNSSVNEGMRTVHHIESNMPNDGSMIGRMVSGVIDGSFDAGYFLSVRIGNNGPFLRGVIFEPGRFTPVTSSNDIAPQAKMFQRRECVIPIPGPQNDVSQSVAKQPGHLGMQQHVVLPQVLPSLPQQSPSILMSNQSSPTMVPIGNMSSNISSPTLAEKMAMQQTPRSRYGSQFQSSPPVENLRMVEQDDAMQVYEVSVQSEGLLVDTEPARDMISESSSEQRGNSVLHQKEIANQANQSLNQDMGSGLDLSSRIHNDFDCLAAENHMALDIRNRQAELKQNQDPYYELHQHHTMIAESQPPPQKIPGFGSGFQQRDLIQNKIQDINLELHETPVVTQTQYVPLENQHMEPDRRLDQERNENSVHMSHPVSLEPASMGDQVNQGKLVPEQLGRENHGSHEAFMQPNSHLLHRELLSQSVDYLTEKPNAPKTDMENGIQLQPEAGISENSGKPIQDSTENGGIDSHNTERGREAMPFDLEIAAEETNWPGRHENRVSDFIACTTELNLIPGNAVLRTETENNPGGLPESQQR